MAGARRVRWLLEQVLAANPDAGVIALGKDAVGVPFAVPGAASALRVIQGLFYPCRQFCIPFLGDVLRPEGNEAGRVNNDVEARAEHRFLRPKYLNPAFPALRADVLDVGGRYIRPGDGLADVVRRRGVPFQEILDAEFHGFIDADVRVLPRLVQFQLRRRQVEAEGWIDAGNGDRPLVIHAFQMGRQIKQIFLTLLGDVAAVDRSAFRQEQGLRRGEFHKYVREWQFDVLQPDFVAVGIVEFLDQLVWQHVDGASVGAMHKGA